MYRADEKKAFEDMLAEISDDSDEELNSATAKAAISHRPSTSRQSSTRSPPPGKSSPRNQAHLSSAADSKNSGSSYTNRGIAMASTQHKVSQMSKEDEAIANFGVQNSSSEAQRQVETEQLNVTKRWLTRPCASGNQTMFCYVERERSSFGMQTIYRCYLETVGTIDQLNAKADSSSSSSSSSSNAGGQQGGGGRFMMSAKKKVVNKTSYYLLSLDRVPNDDRGSDTVLGKVRGNAIGSRYLITDHGLAPDKSVAPSTLRKELGVVSFEFDSGGPSRIECWVPYVSLNGTTSTWQPTTESSGIDSFVESHHHNHNTSNHNTSNNTTTTANGTNIATLGGAGAGSVGVGGGLTAGGVSAVSGGKLMYLQNKTPKWDESHGGHVLNFQGRVTESSVKNFQLCCLDIDNDEDVVLQFGRVGKHKFNLDVRYPLSPMQAFSICVACLDGKIADRKGYEFIKKLAGSANELAETVTKEDELAATNSSPSKNAATSKEGSMMGSTSLSGTIKETIPSSQYIKDKLKRSFK